MCDVNDLSFSFDHTATTEIYTLSLHDALPISRGSKDRLYLRLRRRLGTWHSPRKGFAGRTKHGLSAVQRRSRRDRKSTRLNSSHRCISYAVFCLKKKKQHRKITEKTNANI